VAEEPCSDIVITHLDEEFQQKGRNSSTENITIGRQTPEHAVQAHIAKPTKQISARNPQSAKRRSMPSVFAELFAGQPVHRSLIAELDRLWSSVDGGDHLQDSGGLQAGLAHPNGTSSRTPGHWNYAMPDVSDKVRNERLSDVASTAWPVAVISSAQNLAACIDQSRLENNSDSTECTTGQSDGKRRENANKFDSNKHKHRFLPTNVSTLVEPHRPRCSTVSSVAVRRISSKCAANLRNMTLLTLSAGCLDRLAVREPLVAEADSERLLQLRIENSNLSSTL